MFFLPHQPLLWWRWSSSHSDSQFPITELSICAQSSYTTQANDKQKCRSRAAMHVIASVDAVM